MSNSGTHGLSHTREYKAWINMRSRCSNPNTPEWHRYGGRGIRVCERWLCFESFLADMGERPSSKHSLDRIDLDGDYEPDNCRWADGKTQNRNASFNHLIEIDGKTMTLAEAVEATGMKYNTVLYRIKRGWDVSKALKEPTREA